MSKGELVYVVYSHDARDDPMQHFRLEEIFTLAKDAYKFVLKIHTFDYIHLLHHRLFIGLKEIQ